MFLPFPTRLAWSERAVSLKVYTHSSRCALCRRLHSDRTQKIRRRPAVSCSHESGLATHALAGTEQGIV